MFDPVSRPLNRLRRQIRQAMSGPQALAFLPAIVLGAFWIGGESWLLGVSIGLPVIFALSGGFNTASTARSKDGGGSWNPVNASAVQTLDQILAAATHPARMTACFLVCVDDHSEMVDRFGQSAAESVMSRLADRLRSTLRDDDVVLRQDQTTFCLCLAPVRHLDLEAAIQLSGRLQQAVEDPISLDSTTVFISCCVGFCLSSRNPGTSGADLLTAAEAALSEARRHGPSAIRAFADGMQSDRATQVLLADEAAVALEQGQIRPWFQPQISTDTGRITGFEALARWHHPDRGLIPPADFLPALEHSGQMERLGEVMLYHAFTALRQWDEAGVVVPQVGVNFSGQELRNPKLVEKIRWELDRFDLPPHRLGVEILETVVAASPDDTVARTINGLAKLGCNIDLDDFGTGHAAISSIRRFAVGRIKIDRSFVMKVDRDPDQQRMVSAILTMAERLNLETLAEGVETAGEHAMLAQLGCGHVQGFGIGRPMPFDQTLDWIAAHNAKLTEAPKIGRTAR